MWNRGRECGREWTWVVEKVCLKWRAKGSIYRLSGGVHDLASYHARPCISNDSHNKDESSSFPRFVGFQDHAQPCIWPCTTMHLVCLYFPCFVSSMTVHGVVHDRAWVGAWSCFRLCISWCMVAPETRKNPKLWSIKGLTCSFRGDFWLLVSRTDLGDFGDQGSCFDRWFKWESIVWLDSIIWFYLSWSCFLIHSFEPMFAIEYTFKGLVFCYDDVFACLD
jgi:hypothetical protein